MSFLSRLFKRGKDDRAAPPPSPARPKAPSVPPVRDRAPQPVAKPGTRRPRTRPPAPTPKPEPAPSPTPSPTQETVPAPVTAPSTHEPEVRRLDWSMDADRARAILESVLDDLGTAHHRPFSRG